MRHVTFSIKPSFGLLLFLLDDECVFHNLLPELSDFLVFFLICFKRGSVYCFQILQCLFDQLIEIILFFGKCRIVVQFKVNLWHLFLPPAVQVIYQLVHQVLLKFDGVTAMTFGKQLLGIFTNPLLYHMLELNNPTVVNQQLLLRQEPCLEKQKTFLFAINFFLAAEAQV